MPPSLLVVREIEYISCLGIPWGVPRDLDRWPLTVCNFSNLDIEPLQISVIMWLREFITSDNNFVKSAVIRVNRIMYAVNALYMVAYFGLQHYHQLWKLYRPSVRQLYRTLCSGFIRSGALTFFNLWTLKWWFPRYLYTRFELYNVFRFWVDGQQRDDLATLTFFLRMSDSYGVPRARSMIHNFWNKSLSGAGFCFRSYGSFVVWALCGVLDFWPLIWSLLCRFLMTTF